MQYNLPLPCCRDGSRVCLTRSALSSLAVHERGWVAAAALASESQPAARSRSLQPGSARSASRVFLRLTLSGNAARALSPAQRSSRAVASKPKLARHCAGAPQVVRTLYGRRVVNSRRRHLHCRLRLAAPSSERRRPRVHGLWPGSRRSDRSQTTSHLRSRI